MPLTRLDPVPALIVIDLQKGIVGLPVVHPIGEIVGKAVSLLAAFRERGWPVVLVNVTGAAPGRTDAGRRFGELPPDWSELIPELDRQPEDHVISKQRVGAFLGTSLDEVLKRHGVTQVFLAGVATSGGVEATARSAADLGYNVVLVTDAMTDRDEEVHRLCVEKIFPRVGETETTAGVLKMLRG